MMAASSFVEYVTVQLETSINRMRSGLLQPCLRAKFFQPSPLSKLAVSYFIFHIFHVLREREVERSQDLERVYIYIYIFLVFDRIGRTMLGFHRQRRIVQRGHRVFIVLGGEESS